MSARPVHPSAVCPLQRLMPHHVRHGHHTSPSGASVMPHWVRCDGHFGFQQNLHTTNMYVHSCVIMMSGAAECAGWLHVTHTPNSASRVAHPRTPPPRVICIMIMRPIVHPRGRICMHHTAIVRVLRLKHLGVQLSAHSFT